MIISPYKNVIYYVLCEMYGGNLCVQYVSKKIIIV